MPKVLLQDNLIDDLLTVVDEVRDDVYTDLGVRPWRAYLVRRVWSGVEPGDGTITVEQMVEIRPQPLVKVPGLAMQLAVTGLAEAGEIEMREVSLRFREDELQPRDLNPNEEFFIRLVAAYGQNQITRHYVLSKPPEADRDESIGWVLTLQRAQVKEAIDDQGGLAFGLGSSGSLGGP